MSPDVQKHIDASMAQVVWSLDGQDVTRGELWEQFERVRDPEYWKNPIDAHIELEMGSCEQRLLDYAITFFAGCCAEYYISERGARYTNVVADGYYISIGA